MYPVVLYMSGWQNLASDQLTPTPKVFLRTMFSQLKWCENPENFSSEPYACADPSQQVTPSSATRLRDGGEMANGAGKAV